MSSSLIGWIVSILFILGIGAGFLIGMWRGLKRSTVSLALGIVGVIIAFFITPLITGSILSIEININGESSPLHSIILNLLISNEDLSTLVDKNPNLATFFLNLPHAIVNVVLFVAITLAIESLLYIVYKILAVTVFKIKEGEKKHKFYGGAIGAGKILIIVMFAFMPLASLIGIAKTCTSTGDYGINPTAQVMTVEGEDSEENAGVLSSVLPKEVLSIVNGLENNALTKMCGIFGLDDALFDYYGSFEIEGEKLLVREEIVNVYNVVDLTNQLSKVDKSYSFKDFNYEKITKQLNNLSNSPMFENILAETLGEILMNYKEYAFIRDIKFVKDNAEIFDAISIGLKAYTASGGQVSDYFTDDINKIISVATNYAQEGTIDEILALETLDVDGVIRVLANEGNYDLTKSNLQTIFGMNIVRDSVEQIAKKFVGKISTDIDEIGVSTSTWNDEDWNSLSSSLATIAKRYSSICEQVDIMDVIQDATILLDEKQNYDISLILSELGTLIDEARDVNLLKTSENKPIIDKLLSTYNIPLPNNEGVIEEVIENDGTNKTLKSHKDLFEFISPSLVKIRDEKIYSSLNQNTTQTIVSLAEIVSKEGNETILSDILMPLYQVEPTKTLIIQQLKTSIESDLVNLSNLSGYSEWKADLNYISAMLKTLNNKKIGEYTFLTLILNNKMGDVIDGITADEIDEIIKPVFYAKSTIAVKEDILLQLEEDLRSMTGSDTLTLKLDGITFVEGNTEDQTQEFCDVFKKLLPLKENFDFKTSDKALLGEALETMKLNAYRVELSSKTEVGIFKETFVELMNKFKTEYQMEVAYLESNPEMLEEELGVDSLNEENYSKIDYSKLLSLLSQLGI